jgi:hypothetical protein
MIDNRIRPGTPFSPRLPTHPGERHAYVLPVQTATREAGSNPRPEALASQRHLTTSSAVALSPHDSSGNHGKYRQAVRLYLRQVRSTPTRLQGQ